MPIFEGDDPHEWLYRVERYFTVNGIFDEKRVGAATICLEGSALAWFQWCKQRDPIYTWETFKYEISERFRADQDGSYYEEFLSLVQDGTVAAY